MKNTLDELGRNLIGLGNKKSGDGGLKQVDKQVQHLDLTDNR